MDATRRRAADGLAGRTVWCATALPRGRARARSLRGCLQWGGGGDVAAAWLEISARDPLRELAERLDAALRGDRDATGDLGRPEAEILSAGADDGEAMVGAAVGAGDVVVAHDALTAMLAQAVRERGAHAVWHVHLGAAPQVETVARAWRFVRDYTSGLDAYVMTWSEPARFGATVERIAALMPSADVLAATEIPAPYASGEPRLLGWSSVLADVVHDDRHENVGGRLHARPAVAAR